MKRATTTPTLSEQAQLEADLTALCERELVAVLPTSVLRRLLSSLVAAREDNERLARDLTSLSEHVERLEAGRV